jgi:hypothetical protein
MKRFQMLILAFLLLLILVGGSVQLVMPGEKGTPAWARNVEVATQQVLIPAMDAGTNDLIPVFKAPWDCEIVKAGIVPEDNVTPTVDTQLLMGFQSFSQDLFISQTFIHGRNLTAFDFYEFSFTGSKFADEGTVINFFRYEYGSNLATPRMLAVIEYIPQP